VLIAHGDKPVFIYLFNAYGYVTPGIATMFLLGILWRRTTQAGALTAGLLTVPLSALLGWAFPGMPFMNRTGIVFWSCLLACFVVSLLTRPASEADLRGLVWTKGSLSWSGEGGMPGRGWRSPVVWWAAVTGAVLYFYIRYP